MLGLPFRHRALSHHRVNPSSPPSAVAGLLPATGPASTHCPGLLRRPRSSPLPRAPPTPPQFTAAPGSSAAPVRIKPRRPELRRRRRRPPPPRLLPRRRPPPSIARLDAAAAASSRHRRPRAAEAEPLAEPLPASSASAGPRRRRRLHCADVSPRAC
ncbi:hypothetical protein ACP4OV_012644 [Aristida adscensionis]